MAGLTVEESELRRELQEKSLLIGDRAEHLLKFANKLRQELRAGAEFLNAESLSPELAQKQVQTRRRIVEEIVERVDLLADKTIRVKFVLDLAEAGQIETTPPLWGDRVSVSARAGLSDGVDRKCHHPAYAGEDLRYQAQDR